MSPEQENFSQLRRVLVLKRYEQPPPRFFNEFSGHVIARLRAGERGQWHESFPWFAGLWAFLDTRPALAAGFGAAVVAVVIGGVALSDRLDVNQTGSLTQEFTAVAPPSPVAAPVAQTVYTEATNELAGSLFQQFRDSRRFVAVPVSAIVESR
jgi:hypothetical protein